MKENIDLDQLTLKVQSHHDSMLLENPMKIKVLVHVSVLIGILSTTSCLPLLNCTVLHMKVVYSCCGYGCVGEVV